MSFDIGGATRTRVKGSSELQFRRTHIFGLFGARELSRQLKLLEIYVKTGEAAYGTSRTAKENSRNRSKAGARGRDCAMDVGRPSKRLSTFEKNWGKLQEDIKAGTLGVEPESSKTHRAPAGPRPFRAKAPAKLKSLDAAVSSKQESSSTAAEEKQNGSAFRNAANASASDGCLATGPTHGNLVNGVVLASDQSPTLQRASANTPHQPSIGVTSKQPLMLTSDLSFLPETKSKIKQQRIAQATLEVER
ncbi:MAG: hypothetical protein M1830_004750 [Pleopsidium flavum]|nr:MAG: hypothetical protein M1830_004750 [Pleopsidium flavum]